MIKAGRAKISLEDTAYDVLNNPFPGPVPLTGDHPVFGRDDEINNLRGLILAERLVVLHGVSGAGKSSLLQAEGGLASKFARDPNFSVLGPIDFRLSEHFVPVDNGYEQLLLDQLNRQLPKEQQQANNTIWESLDLDIFLMRHADHNPGRRQLLIIDQFEDIFTQHSYDEAGKVDFFCKLGEVLEANRDLYLLLSMREEYLGELDHYRRFVPGRFRATQRLELLHQHQAADAIMKTAEAAPRSRKLCRNDVEALVRYLSRGSSTRVNKAEEDEFDEAGDVEPLFLQLACHDAWNQLDREEPASDEGCIHFARDFSRKELHHVLAFFYARALTKVCGSGLCDEYKLRCLVQDGLISSKGLRSLVSEEEAKRVWGVDAEQLGAFVDQHLIRRQPRNKVVYFELAHDRLVEPIRTNNREWLNQRPAWRRAARRNHLGSDGDKRLDFLTLLKALRFRKREPASLAPFESKYLKQQRRRMRKSALIFVLFFVSVISVYLFTAWLGFKRAQLIEHQAMALQKQNEVQEQALTKSGNELKQQRYKARLRGQINAYVQEKWVKRDDQEAAAQVVSAYRLAQELFPEPDQRREFKNELITAFNNALSVTDGSPGYSHVLPGRQGREVSLAFYGGSSPLEAYLDGECLRVRSLRKNGNPRCLLPLEEMGGIARTLFAPDGRSLVLVMGQRLLLLEIATGEKLHSSEYGEISAMKFAHNGAGLLFAVGAEVRYLCPGVDGWNLCWQQRVDLAPAASITQVDLSMPGSEGSLLAIGTSGGRVDLFRLPENDADLTLLRSFADPGRIYQSNLADRRNVFGLHFLSADPARLIVVHEDTQIFAILDKGGEGWQRQAIEPDFGSQLYGARSEEDNDHYDSLAVSDEHVLYLVLEDAIDTWDFRRLDFESVEGQTLKMPMIRYRTGGRDLQNLSVGSHYLMAQGFFRTWIWERHTKGALKLAGEHYPNDETGLEGSLIYYPQAVVITAKNEIVAGTTQHGLEYLSKDQQGNRLARQLGRCEGRARSVRALAYSREKRLVAAASSHKRLLLASLDDPTAVQCDDQAHEDGLWSVAFDRGSDWLASGDWKGHLVLWRIDGEGRLQKSDVITPEGSSVMSLAFHPQDDLLAVGMRSGEAYLYRLEPTGRLKLETALAFATEKGIGRILALDFSADGSLLAAAGSKGPIQVWRYDEGYQPANTLIGHAGGTRSLAFNPQGERLASGGADGILRLWDIMNLNQTPAMLRSHDADILSIAWAPDGRSLVTSFKQPPQLGKRDEDADPVHGRIVIWNWNLEFFAEVACRSIWRKSAEMAEACTAKPTQSEIAKQ